MKQISTEIVINAPIEKVWEVLTDIGSYAAWNPFIRKIDGILQVGNQLAATIQPANKKPMIFRPKVMTVSNYAFSWTGNLLIPGIFDGNHHFRLESINDNQVRFIHSENFSGILCVPLFSMIGDSTKAGFEDMNRALKEKCEA